MLTKEMDIDAIFQKNSIVGVQDHLKKLRNDIEKKKEDLRIMVGERYRDLIEAADTIEEMQKSTESISTSIETVEKLCESLQQRGLIGFKTRKLTLAETVRSNESNASHKIASQIKVLVDAPETLWDVTEKQDYLSAAQIYLLSQYTHTALQLTPNSQKINDKFPVINFQWSSISQFKPTILKGCRKVIQSEMDNVKAVLNSLSAMMLLEGLNARQVLDKILDLRKEKLESVLAPSSSAAKDQLIDFSLLLMSSLFIVHQIFTGDEEEPCLLEKAMRRITGDWSSQSISALPDSALSMSLSSKNNFRVQPKGDFKTLDSMMIQEAVSDWLEIVRRDSSVSIQKLLGFTNTVKAFLLIRNGIEDAQEKRRSKFDWQKVLEMFKIEKNFSPWRSIIKERILERLKQLLEKELSKIKNDFRKSILETTQEIFSNKKVWSEEGDITTFVWSESAQDAPEEIGAFSNKNNQNNNNTGLFFKSRGFTKRVQAITKSFDQRLRILIEDVFPYAPKTSDESDISDHEDILRFVEDTSIATFTKCLEDLQTISKTPKPDEEYEFNDSWDQMKTVRPNPELTVAIFCGRILMALPILCTNMRVCVCALDLSTPETARRLQMGLVSDSAKWTALKTSMNDANSRIMEGLFGMLLQRFSTQLKQDLIVPLQNGTSMDLMHIFSAWETVTIEEENEEGSIVQSKIEIPQQSTPMLVQALVKLCSSLNHIGMHTVSRHSHHKLVSLLSEKVTSAYQELENSIDNFNQITAVQIMFDIKLIQLMFVPKENKEASTILSSLVEKLEAQIDPFDWNVFSPHITSRVRSAAHKLHVVLGVLLAKEKQLGTKTPTTSVTGIGTLIVVPSVEIPRFPNVPLPDSSAHVISTELERLQESFTASASTLKESKTTVDLRSLNEQSLPSSKSSGSLFSVMSSSWFGNT